jgi:hypothetical protein
METKTASKAVKGEKKSEVTEKRPKSKTTLFREKYPEGVGSIVNMRAVLR